MQPDTAAPLRIRVSISSRKRGRIKSRWTEEKIMFSSHPAAAANPQVTVGGSVNGNPMVL